MSTIRASQSRRSLRRGATLIDVATGSMLLAVLLIPAVHLIGRSEASQRRLDLREIMIYQAEQLLESTRVALSEPNAFHQALAVPADTVRILPGSDGPDLAARVRVAADPTLPTAPLLSMVVDVWRDLDGDMNLDTDEPSQSLRTQWAAP
jgi:hypothetical protein